MVAHNFNLSTHEAEAGRFPEFQVSQSYIVKLSQKVKPKPTNPKQKRNQTDDVNEL